MGFRLVRELAADGIPVAVACRSLNVSKSDYYEWAGRALSVRAVADAELTTTIRRIHADSRQTYGAPRVLAELRLGLGIRVGRKRVARLMRLGGLVGVSHRRKRRGWKPDTATHEDLVKRQFRADAPNRLWFCDITQHRANDGWVYCAAVIDAYSRRIVGWSISDRITAEIVVDALEMARWRRRPEPGTVVHADRGAQYTSWLFGHRLRQAGLLGSMGRVASSVDNALIESFWSTMQRELLDRSTWTSKTQLASAMFEWIEAFYTPPPPAHRARQPQPRGVRTTSQPRRNPGMINKEKPSGKPGQAP
ncbi:IS3 family transposase [Cryobacterium tepidiphilum]|uniref:IS3 family transposase n=1 Tax=Cryobacterium tepidiphilum TaxID=2486026 RepID=A0A3M8LA24_9MICO|nr:IS3 family transposase [Cryobacterium tepidiphilum]